MFHILGRLKEGSQEFKVSLNSTAKTPCLKSKLTEDPLLPIVPEGIVGVTDPQSQGDLQLLSCLAPGWA